MYVRRTEDELKTQYPAELEVLFMTRMDSRSRTFDRMTDEIENVIKENGRVIQAGQKESMRGRQSCCLEIRL